MESSHSIFRRLQSQLAELLEARKAAPTGTVNTRADGDYEKQANGTWKRVSKAKAASGDAPKKSPRKARTKAEPKSTDSAEPKPKRTRAKKAAGTPPSTMSAIKQSIKKAREEIAVEKKSATKEILKKVKKTKAEKTVAARKTSKKPEKVAPEETKPEIKSENLVSLPPPPPYPFSQEQKKDYNKAAFGVVEDSRESWNIQLGRKYNLSEKIHSGFTYSSKQFDGIRKEYAKSLDKEEMDACLFYGDMGDRVLNTSHRYDTMNSEEPNVKAMNENLIKAIRKHSLPEDTYVARGLMGKWAVDFGAALKPGDTFQEKGFTSTSATIPFEGEVQMRIKLPKGTNAAPIPTRYTEENEYLLPPGSKFKVIAIGEDLDNYDKKIRKIEVEVVQ